jgi:hypothetical protein
MGAGALALKGSSETTSVEEAGTITPPFQVGTKSTEAKTVEVPSSLPAPSAASHKSKSPDENGADNDNDGK